MNCDIIQKKYTPPQPFIGITTEKNFNCFDQREETCSRPMQQLLDAAELLTGDTPGGVQVDRRGCFLFQLFGYMWKCSHCFCFWWGCREMFFVWMLEGFCFQRIFSKYGKGKEPFGIFFGIWGLKDPEKWGNSYGNQINAPRFLYSWEDLCPVFMHGLLFFSSHTWCYLKTHMPNYKAQSPPLGSRVRDLALALVGKW